jgi:hypothetical protein
VEVEAIHVVLLDHFLYQLQEELVQMKQVILLCIFQIQILVEKFHGKAMEVGVEPLQYGLAQVVVVVVLVQQHLLLLEELEEL